MKRREFVAGLAGAVAWPRAVPAQQMEGARRIGILLPASADDSDFQTRVGAFLGRALERLGGLLCSFSHGAAARRLLARRGLTRQDQYTVGVPPHPLDREFKPLPPGRSI